MIQDLAVYLGTRDGALILCVAAALLLLVMGSAICWTGKKDRLDSLLTAFLIMELSAAFILLSFGFEGLAETDSDPQLVPLLWGSLLFFCSALQFVRIWIKKDYKPVQYGHVGKVAAVIAVVAAALLVFNWLGFFVSTGLMLTALMLLMGERRKVLIAVTSIVWMAATWAIFNKLLLLGLPVGALFTK